MQTESREARIPFCIDHCEDLLRVFPKKTGLSLVDLVTQAQLHQSKRRLALRVPLKSVVSAARLLAAGGTIVL